MPANLGAGVGLGSQATVQRKVSPYPPTSSVRVTSTAAIRVTSTGDTRIIR